MKSIFRIAVSAFFLLSSAAFGEHLLEAKKDGVKVYQKASKKSDVVHTMKKGRGLKVALAKVCIGKLICQKTAAHLSQSLKSKSKADFGYK